MREARCNSQASKQLLRARVSCCKLNQNVKDDRQPDSSAAAPAEEEEEIRAQSSTIEAICAVVRVEMKSFHEPPPVCRGRSNATTPTTMCLGDTRLHAAAGELAGFRVAAGAPALAAQWHLPRAGRWPAPSRSRARTTGGRRGCASAQRSAPTGSLPGPRKHKGVDTAGAWLASLPAANAAAERASASSDGAPAQGAKSWWKDGGCRAWLAANATEPQVDRPARETLGCSTSAASQSAAAPATSRSCSAARMAARMASGDWPRRGRSTPRRAMAAPSSRHTECRRQLPWNRSTA